MYTDGWYGVVKDRMAHERASAAERRLARTAAAGPNIRARMARGLFALAVAVENEEAWRAVWDRLGESR